MQEVLRFEQIDTNALIQLLQRYQLRLELVSAGDIPGSYWGEEEAGLVGDILYARTDTPIHSILHEGCHYICMDQARRAKLDTDAEGEFEEENAVCYLQILLADLLPGVGKKRMMQDMDKWGYTFRLGSARLWFEQDAQDANEWLTQHHLINQHRPTFQLRC